MASRDQGLIHIVCTDGTVPRIPADVYGGDLALHKDVSGDGTYALTHVRTGCAVLRHIDTARLALECVMQLKDLDWRFDDPLDVSYGVQAVMREIKHWHNGGPMTHKQYETWARVWNK